MLRGSGQGMLGLLGQPCSLFALAALQPCSPSGRVALAFLACPGLAPALGSEVGGLAGSRGGTDTRALEAKARRHGGAVAL